MNKFQAMAQIMAILCEGGHLKPGTRKHKIARQLISGKIDKMGPEAALAQVKKWKGHLLDQIDIMTMLQGAEGKFPFKGI